MTKLLLKYKLNELDKITEIIKVFWDFNDKFKRQFL